MRCGVIVAAALTGIVAGALPTTGAQAEEWCGYAPHADSIIECGYTSASGCEDSIGKGATCFVNPDYALDTKRATPIVLVNYSYRR